jgi:predicted amidophosphoribosyltransferase
MALITCRECGKQISSDAMQCPQCGANVANTIPKVFARFAVIAVLLAVIGWLLGGC